MILTIFPWFAILFIQFFYLFLFFSLRLFKKVLVLPHQKPTSSSTMVISHPLLPQIISSEVFSTKRFDTSKADSSNQSITKWAWRIWVLDCTKRSMISLSETYSFWSKSCSTVYSDDSICGATRNLSVYKLQTNLHVNSSSLSSNSVWKKISYFRFSPVPT